MIFMFIFWICAFISSAALLSLFYNKWQDQYIPSVKGPTVKPFLGNVGDFPDPSTMIQVMHTFHQQFGKNFKAYFGHLQHVFTMDVNLIELTATNNSTINKGELYRYLFNWLGTGLLTSSDKKWHQRRKMITPAYHFKILEHFVDIFDRNGRIMVDKLRSEVKNPQTDIYPFINLCALDVISESAMGTQVNAQLAADSEFVQATKMMSRIITDRSLKMLKAIDFTYQFTEDYRSEKAALKILHECTMNIIKSRRTELIKLQQNQTKGDVDDFGAKKRSNFLDLLLQSSVDGQPLSNEDIREEVDTFMFEGHDTVSSGISFALYLLSHHPAVQERVVEEQKEVYGAEPNRQTTLRDLQNMKYLELVIKEVLRIYPSVPFLVREVSNKLMFNDCTLVKGSQVVVNVYALHHDPEVFPEPDKFIPERFSTENSQGRHPYAYIPFSAGHRNCIGQKFAMLEMKSSISKVIRNYKLLPIEYEPILMPELVLRADNGVLVKLKDREW